MKRVAMSLLTIVLAACAGGSRGTPPMDVFDFGVPVRVPSGTARWSQVALEVKAPRWRDAPTIDYRLLYENPLKLRSYAASRWAGPPTQLLAQQWQQQLGVVVGGGRPAVTCLLVVDLREFAQWFDTPQLSRGVLHGYASVFDATRRPLAQRLLTSEQTAVGADARAGVGALVASGDELGRQLANWLNDLEKRGRLNDCRSTSLDSQ